MKISINKSFVSIGIMDVMNSINYITFYYSISYFADITTKKELATFTQVHQMELLHSNLLYINETFSIRESLPSYINFHTDLFICKPISHLFKLQHRIKYGKHIYAYIVMN